MMDQFFSASRRFLSGKKGIFIPVIFGIVAMILTWQYINQKEKQLGLQGELIPVLIATKDIPRLVRIDETMIEEKKIPKQFVQPGVLAVKKEALDQLTTVSILKGEQVLGTKLASYGLATGLAIKIPKGMRAVTIRVDEESGIAGLIKPGDYVDAVASFEFGDGQKSNQKVYTIMQSILVLAVNQALDPMGGAGKSRDDVGKGGKGLMDTADSRDRDKVTNISVGVTPEQAQNLILAREAGHVRFLLRSMFDDRQAKSLSSTSLKELLGLPDKVYVAPPMMWREFRGTKESRD